VTLLRSVLPLLLVSLVWAQDESRELFHQIGAISSELEQITGLRLKHAVPYDFMTREKVGEYLNKRLKEAVKPDEIRAEEITLKKFGLVPPDFDLAKNTIDLLTEQAAAFYDYHAKKLYLTAAAAPGAEQPALVHELAHALADQHFDLARFIRQGRQSDDGSLARMAVMEGQASWLMSEYLARKNGQSLRERPALARAMSDSTEDGAGSFPVYEGTPLYLRRSLLFPYTEGLLFQQAVMEKFGAGGFGEVFRHAPASTQQILHPEKYFAAALPAQPSLPAVKLPRGFKELVGGTFGEFDAGVLIEQYAGKQKARDLAPHWRGGQYDLRERRGREARVILLFAIAWDGEEAARDFLAVYRAVLEKKWKRMEIAAEPPAGITGRGDDGWFRLRREGSVVRGVEGLEAEVH
jgi:hypothetical protein